MTEHLWEYTYDEQNSEVHIYASDGSEINNSPVDVSTGDAEFVYPDDITIAITKELQQEVNSNQQAGDVVISDYAMEIIAVLAAPQQLIQRQ